MPGGVAGRESQAVQAQPVAVLVGGQEADLHALVAGGLDGGQERVGVLGAAVHECLFDDQGPDRTQHHGATPSPAAPPELPSTGTGRPAGAGRPREWGQGGGPCQGGCGRARPVPPTGVRRHHRHRKCQRERAAGTRTPRGGLAPTIWGSASTVRKAFMRIQILASMTQHGTALVVTSILTPVRGRARCATRSGSVRGCG